MTLASDDPVRALMGDGALPDFSANPVGVAARAGLVSKLEASVPGNGPSDGSLFSNGQGPSYESVFFGSATLSPLERDVTAVTGIPDDRWAEHATALLCQSMYEQTTNVRAQLDPDEINAGVAALNTDVAAPAAASAWYGHALANCQPVVKAALATITSAGTVSDAKQRYIDELTSKEWITEKREALKDLSWLNADWELYHHWVRLSLLGATPAEIANLIASMQAENLTVDLVVDGAHWQSYVVWLGAPLSHADIDADARAGIFEVRNDVYTPPRGSEDIDEGFSFAFVDDGQPGAAYTPPPPSGSCVAAGALVSMADGRLEAIERVRPGARVLTVRGPRTVAVVATPARGRRPLYSIGGSALRVTEMHPLASGDGLHGVLAVKPRALSRWVPTMDGAGIDRLAPGSRALAWTSDGPQPVEIASVTEEPGDDSTVAETLYDIICEPDEHGIPPYVAGDGETQLVVLPELPRITAAPHAARAVLAMLEEVEPALRARLAETADHELPAALDALLRPLRGRLTDAVAGARANGDGRAPVALPEHVRGRMETFSGADAGYDRIRGAVLELLAAHFAAPLDEAVRLRGRELHAPGDRPPDSVAVTLLDLHTEAGEPPLGEISADVRLAGVEPFEEVDLEPSPAPDSPFTRRLDRVSVFAAPAGDEVVAVRVTLRVAGADPLIGTAALAEATARPHRRLEALMRPSAGEPCGRLTLDLRPLSRDALDRERRTRVTGAQDDPSDYAEALGRALGALLAQALTPLAVGSDR